MASKDNKDNGSKTTTTRRSRRSATAPATILANCIAELDKLDSGAEREQVLRSIHAFYGGKLALPVYRDTKTRSADQQIVDEEHGQDRGA
jgi:hypothetical protein